MTRELSRREAVRRGVLSGGALLGATGIAQLLDVGNAFAKREGDAAILRRAIELEQTAAATYDAVAEKGLLRGPLRATARLLRDQEREHAKALTAAGKDLGLAATRPPRPEQVGIEKLKSQTAVLRFLINLENMIVVAYIDTHRSLEDEKLLGTVAEIMASEGQHLVVLREALGKDPVPGAFEAGTSA